MAPGKYEKPAEETIPDSKQDRIALLALIDKWLERNKMKARRLSTYIDLDLLKLPADAQFPREWSDQTQATPYRSYSSAKTQLDQSGYIDVVKQMKKVVDPHFFLDRRLDSTTVTHLNPHLQAAGPNHPASSAIIDQVMKRPGEITAKLITEVGTAILIWTLQDPRFISELPPFKTDQQRLAWFRKILRERPLLYLVLMYQCFGSSLGIPFVFSSWQYNGAINKIQSDMLELICQRTLLVLNAIFRGMFNFDFAKGVKKIGSFRNWITTQTPSLFWHSQLEPLKPKLNKFPVAPRWPNQNRRVPWASVSGAAENADVDVDNVKGDDDDDDDETPKSRKRGKASGGGGLGGNKRQRR